MEREGKLKLDAYDRMFPCQDTLPNGGFGNLIALPLQGQARKKGNSLFMDEMLQPYPDQWAYLSTMRKLGLEEVDAIIKAHSHGDVLGNLCVVESTSKPWERQKKVALSALDFYGVQHIVRANMIYIPANGFAPRVRNQLLRLAAFRNPDFYKSQAMRLPIYDTPRIICAAEERDGYLALPRCCEPDLIELLETAGASYEIEDKTFGGNGIQRFLKLLPQDIHLTVVTGDESSVKPEAWEKMSNAVKLLEDTGARVILQPKVYQRYAVIDKSTLWYGGINFLGFEKVAHGAMRLCSTELANELCADITIKDTFEQLEIF